MSHARYNESDALSSIGSEATETDGSLCLDDVFMILSNSRRRASLRILMEHENLDKSELVDRVAEVEYQLPIEQISGDERHKIYVSIVQSHLSKLEQHDIIRMDGNRVLLGSNAQVLEQYLSKIDTQSFADKMKQSVMSLC